MRLHLRTMRVGATLTCSALAVGCSGSHPTTIRPVAALDAHASARTLGTGPRFRPPARGIGVAHGAPVDGLRCSSGATTVAAAHVEVFAENDVLLIAAGIGVAPPLMRHGAHIVAGGCSYPLRTVEPTGLLLLTTRRSLTLGQLFDLWGQPLERDRVASFRAPRGQEVRVFIDGRPWMGSPRAAPISGGGQLTVEVGSHVPPHTRYTFPSQRAITSMP